MMDKQRRAMFARMRQRQLIQAMRTIQKVHPDKTHKQKIQRAIRDLKQAKTLSKFERFVETHPKIGTGLLIAPVVGFGAATTPAATVITMPYLYGGLKQLKISNQRYKKHITQLRKQGYTKNQAKILADAKIIRAFQRGSKLRKLKQIAIHPIKSVK